MNTAILFILTLGFFFAVPVVAAIRGQYLWGAIAAFFIQFMPIAWQLAFTDDDAPGFAFLLLATLPISVMFLGFGIVNLVIRRRRGGHDI